MNRVIILVGSRFGMKQENQSIKLYNKPLKKNKKKSIIKFILKSEVQCTLIPKIKNINLIFNITLYILKKKCIIFLYIFNLNFLFLRSYYLPHYKKKIESSANSIGK